MSVSDNRRKRGWFRRGDAPEAPAAPEPAEAPAAPVRYDDPWSADAWSEEGWDDEWNDRTRRARVRPAADPRAADVDAWLESDQSQFADVTADMARRWDAALPGGQGASWDPEASEAAGATWDDDTRVDDGRTPPSLGSVMTTTEAGTTWGSSGPVGPLDTGHAGPIDAGIDTTVDEELLRELDVPTGDAASAAIDEELRVELREPEQAELPGASHERTDPTLAADLLDELVAEPGDRDLLADLAAELGTAEAPGAATAEADVLHFDEPAIEPLPLAGEADGRRDEDTDEERRIDALLSAPPLDDDLDLALREPDPAVEELLEGEPTDPDPVRAAIVEPLAPAQTEEAAPAIPDPWEDRPDDLEAPAASAPEPVAAAEPAADTTPEPAPIPRPGSTWDDDVEERLDQLLAAPITASPAIDEADPFGADVDRSIEQELVAEFGSEDDPVPAPPRAAAAGPNPGPNSGPNVEPRRPRSPRRTAAPTPASTASPEPAVIQPAPPAADVELTDATPIADVASLAREPLPAPAEPVPTTEPLTVVQDRPAAPAPSQSPLPPGFRRLSTLLLAVGAALVVTAVVRLLIVVAGYSSTSGDDGDASVALVDRLGRAATRVGTVHGVMLVGAVVCAVLAAAASGSRRRTDERLAGWICGGALAAGLMGLAGAVLGVRLQVDQADTFSEIAPQLADLVGLAVTSIVAIWAGWHASAPRPD